MKKKSIFIMLLFISMVLSARDNPFSSTKNTQNTGQSINIKDTRENFSEVKINFPSTARILKSVELHYQNLDGSIQSKKIKIDQKIDWHNELVLKKQQDVNAFYVKPIKEKEPTSKLRQKIVNFKNIISFSISNKKLYITTNDAKIRDFLVANPYKIVLDFKRELSFNTKKINLSNERFKNIIIGKHDGYYRVVVELDGQYEYSLQKIKNKYTIILK